VFARPDDGRQKAENGMGQAAEDILNGPDYFKCEAFRVRMKKAHCIDRQDRANRAMGTDFRYYDSDTWATCKMDLSKCVACEQGKEIQHAADEHRMVNDGHGRGEPCVRPDMGVRPDTGIRPAGRPSHKRKGDDDMSEERAPYEAGKAETKKCSICLEHKPLETFNRHRQSKDGHRSECRDCQNRRARQRSAARKKAPAPQAVAPAVLSMDKAAVKEVLMDVLGLLLRDFESGRHPLQAAYENCLHQAVSLKAALMEARHD